MRHDDRERYTGPVYRQRLVQWYAQTLAVDAASEAQFNSDLLYSLYSPALLCT